MEQLVYALIGGGVVGAFVSGAVTLWTTRHKPRVDTAQVLTTAQGNFIDDLREQLKNANEENVNLKAALKACEDQARQERARHDTRERDMQTRNDAQQRQIGALGDRLDVALGHLWLLETGIADETIPPIPERPYAIRHMLTAGHDTATVVRDDNGVPGTETNPPPPDDGQDLPPE